MTQQYSGKDFNILRKNKGLFAVKDLLDNRNPGIVIISFGILLLCIIWIGLFFKIQAERQLEIDRAYKDTARFARAFEEHIIRTFMGADQVLISFKYQYEKEVQGIDVPRYVREQKIVGQLVLQLSVVNENGDSVASSQVPFISANIKDREHFLVHKEGDARELFVSKPVLGRVSGKWSIQMSRRINKQDGAFGGVLVLSVDPFYFTEFYKQVDLGKESAISLVGRDGIIRARQSDQVSVTGQDVRNSPLMENLASCDIGQYIATSPVDNIKRIYSYRSMTDYPFVVLVGVAEEEVFKDLNNRISGYYLAAGTSTLVIVIFISMLLFISFQQQNTAQALKQARDSLELKVEQRTRELTSKNEETRSMNEELQITNQELETEIARRIRIESSLKTSEEELVQKNIQLAAALQDINAVQASLIQQEKFAGIGQLAAGVAHEINNPLGFITGNVEALEEYFKVFSVVIAQYRELLSELASVDDPQILAKVDQIVHVENEQDLEYILADIPDVFRDTNGGMKRISKIIKGMRLFSRVDQQQVFEQYDLNKGLENTLLIAHGEIKHSAVAEENYGPIPEIEAIGGEINQVLLNLIFNAVHSIREKHKENQGTLKLSTWHDGQFVFFSIEDDGNGIAVENLNNIFNPFFTTKPVGQGTGMGLSISYEIIVNHHQGDIAVESNLGVGTKFIVKLPIKHDFA